MNAHDLARELLRGPNLPVVCAQDLNPAGNAYTVTGVELVTMTSDGLWDDPQVWHAGYFRDHDRAQVVHLGTDQPAVEVVDADIVEPHQAATTACPSCSNTLHVSTTTLPGDRVACQRCQQIVVLPPAAVITPAAGEPRTVLDAVLDHCTDDTGHVSMVVALARLDQAVAVGRCFVCDTQTGDALLCPECAATAHIGVTG